MMAIHFTAGGFMEVSGSIINCHEHSGHGTVTVKEGLIQSCNPTMMQIAAKLGWCENCEI